MLRPAQLSDAAAILAIYNPYIEKTTISFEEEPVSLVEMQQRIAAYALPWLVYELDGQIVGYAYASPWKTRSAYRYSVETSVYVAEQQVGKGIGRALYRALLEALRSHEVHAIIAGIALPNPASIALHEAMGFVKIAHFKQVGRKFGRWLDVGYWELLSSPEPD